jgi:hypothetical protein
VGVRLGQPEVEADEGSEGTAPAGQGVNVYISGWRGNGWLLIHFVRAWSPCSVPVQPLLIYLLFGLREGPAAGR